jgi:hypothetical protein
MDEQPDDMFMEKLDEPEFSFGFGESSGAANQHAADASDESNELRFLEEFKARDEDFLSLMRNYDHLIFRNGLDEARAAALELAASKQTIKKSDIISMFSHAGGWKIGHLEKAGLFRIMGKQFDGELIDAPAFQQFAMSTSIGKNDPHHAFQPKLPSKLLCVITEGWPAKTSIAYVNSLCSEYGNIRDIKDLDSGSKHAKHHPKFLVTFADEPSASRAAARLQGFSSKRIPGPLSCRLCDGAVP